MTLLKKLTQKQKVLSLLRSGGSVTNLEAKLYLSIPNLYLHISRLRREGYKIKGTEQDTPIGKRTAYDYPRWVQLFDRVGRTLAKYLN